MALRYVHRVGLEIVLLGGIWVLHALWHLLCGRAESGSRIWVLEVCARLLPRLSLLLLLLCIVAAHAAAHILLVRPERLGRHDGTRKTRASSPWARLHGGLAKSVTREVDSEETRRETAGSERRQWG